MKIYGPLTGQINFFFSHGTRHSSGVAILPGDKYEYVQLLGYYVSNCFMIQAQIEENYNVSCAFLYYDGLRLSIPQGWL